jgi:hypothetical protein
MLSLTPCMNALNGMRNQPSRLGGSFCTGAYVSFRGRLASRASGSSASSSGSSRRRFVPRLEEASDEGEGPATRVASVDAVDRGAFAALAFPLPEEDDGLQGACISDHGPLTIMVSKNTHGGQVCLCASQLASV